MMSFKDYLIEVGKQTVINESGTTEIGESKLHLRKWTKSNAQTQVSKAVDNMQKINRKLARTKETDQKVELLSSQFQELSKILMIMVSVQMD